jgi:aminoglycoside N3'-acetyltransferase
MIIESILTDLERVIGDRRENIVFYTAIWPLLRISGKSPQILIRELCANFIERFPGSTLLMPTFTPGLDNNGICNLDKSPSCSGVLSEYFRNYPGVQRTRSAFFSFAVHGPNSEKIMSLRPQEAWGHGSLYEWIFEQDASIVTLGLHPTHSSYGHYGEWLNKKHITYRQDKTFAGTLISNNEELAYSETLFIRRRKPEPVNNFTGLLQGYIEAGMRISSPSGFTISCISSRKKIEVVNNAINQDPLALIANKELFV